jgi:DNA-directed RNA polymerase III subunit RPC1
MLKNSNVNSKWISEYGFSIGIDDVTSTNKLFYKKAKLICHGYNLCRSVELIPKKNEHKIHKILSLIRDDLGKHCMSVDCLKGNSALIMVASGSKGSVLNLAQMIFCLGQQSVSGKRITNGMLGRTLPNFQPNFFKTIPEHNGFIENSLYQGLDNRNFFFHAVAGREGLVDTAVKTAETGYLQRRLLKSLEDIVSFYDSSVRTSDGRLIQFKFGDDNLDPVKASHLFDAINLTSGIMGRRMLFEYNFLKLFEIDSFSKAFYFYDIESFCYFGGFINLFYSSYMANYFKQAINFTQLELVFKKISKISALCINDPGSSVGAGAGQSIGEPGTQMTLQTFHFAGISNMNITLGVPRINEIMNACKNINSSIVNISFVTLG